MGDKIDFPASSPTPVPPMVYVRNIAWEYKLITSDVAQAPGEEELYALGKDGWELAAVLPYGRGSTLLLQAHQRLTQQPGGLRFDKCRYCNVVPTRHIGDFTKWRAQGQKTLARLIRDLQAGEKSPPTGKEK